MATSPTLKVEMKSDGWKQGPELVQVLHVAWTITVPLLMTEGNLLLKAAWELGRQV